VDIRSVTALKGDDSHRTADAILRDVLTLTRRCDPCWGTGVRVADAHHLGDGVYAMDEDTCAPCNGTGRVRLVAS
jgi:DnaJ-class molecular chaperone